MGDQRNPEEGHSETSCAATKRDGETCGSSRVTVSGYCFAHDPESVSWRAMGGKATARKRRATKWVRDAGMGRLYDMLEESFFELSEQEVTPANLQAMARLSDTILKLVKWSKPEPDVLDYIETELRKPPEWTPY